jgi:hypothetical protein
MAFYPPRFNVWVRVYRYNSESFSYDEVGYTIAQLRGSDSKQDITSLLPSLCQILLPKGTDVRGTATSLTGVGDLVYPAGYGAGRYVVAAVCDKGAGFANEYRECNCYLDPFSELYALHPNGLLRVNVNLLPPDGFAPVPVRDPSDSWHAFP